MPQVWRDNFGDSNLKRYAVAFAGGVEIAGVSVDQVTDIFSGGGNEAPAARNAGGELKLINASDRVLNQLRVMGLSPEAISAPLIEARQ